MQISVQTGLNWNWPTGTDLGKNVAGQSKSIGGDTKATNSLKVCVPNFTPSEAVTQKPEDIKHCFDV